MKSTGSAIGLSSAKSAIGPSSAKPTSFTLRREESPHLIQACANQGRASIRGMYRLETYTDQISITRRKGTRSHEITTISLCPEPLRETWHPHIYPRSSGWKPMRGCHYPIKGGHKKCTEM